MTGPHDVLDFWFDPASERRWWKRSDAFDDAIRARFGATHAAAVRCELHAWRATPEGRLAEVIVLDQFSRNLHRDSALAWAADPLALGLAQEALAAGADRALDARRRVFLCMPFMHSESRAIHALAPALFADAPDSLESERRHAAIIDRFGRFPHRNALLGRTSTPEEIAFLRTPGSSF